MGDLSVFMVATGSYQSYLPWSVLSWYRTYPTIQYYCCVGGRLTGNVRRALDSLPYSPVILENQWQGFPRLVPNRIKSLRWTTPVAELQDRITTTYLYTGDIDILVVPEEVPLLDGHLQHMRQLGLPYSNVIRNYRRASHRRLSGLHFVDWSKWCELTHEVMLSAHENLKRVVPRNNERVLTNIVRQSKIGLPPRGSPRYRPHHGVHIRGWESKKVRRRCFAQDVVPWWEQTCGFLDDLIQSAEGKHLCRLLPGVSRRIRSVLRRIRASIARSNSA